MVINGTICPFRSSPEQTKECDTTCKLYKVGRTVNAIGSCSIAQISDSLDHIGTVLSTKLGR